MATRLPRTSPRSVNVDATGIAAFLDALAGTELHSVMVLRHGRVLAEGWWRPYVADEIQLGYSLTKSFTSVALSYALAEGLVRLDDRVSDVLDAPAGIDPGYERLTVRDLARMTTGHTVDPLDEGSAWPPLQAEPGGVWIYNNWASLTLGDIVAKVSGRSLTGYLESRLFEPLDIEDWAWDGVGGREAGFSGLHLATESWAKFGHLLLRGGELWDRQVIDAGFLAEATRKQSDNSVEPDGRPRESGPDWRRGYGYQFWVSRHGFRGDGAYGQFVVVLPEQDAVLVVTSATDDMQAILTAAWDHVLPAFGADPRGAEASGEVSEADAELAARLAGLSLVPVSSRAPDDCGSFSAASGYQALASVREILVGQDDEGYDLTLFLASGGSAQLAAGDGRWVTGSLPVEGADPMPVGVSAGWTSDDTFEVELRHLQTPHGVWVVCDKASGTFTSSWLTIPLGKTEFTQLALREGVRHHP